MGMPWDIQQMERCLVSSWSWLQINSAGTYDMVLREAGVPLHTSECRTFELRTCRKRLTAYGIISDQSMDSFSKASMSWNMSPSKRVSRKAPR